MPIITQELLESGRSIRGGFNLAQLKIILPMKEFAGLRKGEFPQKGWAWRAIDREISQAQYEDFLRLKDRHLAHKKRELAGQKELW